LVLQSLAVKPSPVSQAPVKVPPLTFCMTTCEPLL
jgi:hypothetical protein